MRLTVGLVCFVCLVHLVCLVRRYLEIFNETRDDSARRVACLLIPSKRFLLQHNEYAKGKVPTQYVEETFKS